MDGPASCQDPETSRRQRRLEKDHQNICGAPTAPQRLRAADADDDDLLYISVQYSILAQPGVSTCIGKHKTEKVSS